MIDIREDRVYESAIAEAERLFVWGQVQWFDSYIGNQPADSPVRLADLSVGWTAMWAPSFRVSFESSESTAIENTELSKDQMMALARLHIEFGVAVLGAFAGLLFRSGIRGTRAVTEIYDKLGITLAEIRARKWLRATRCTGPAFEEVHYYSSLAGWWLHVSDTLASFVESVIVPPVYDQAMPCEWVPVDSGDLPATSRPEYTQKNLMTLLGEARMSVRGFAGNLGNPDNRKSVSAHLSGKHRPTDKTLEKYISVLGPSLGRELTVEELRSVDLSQGL
jgi:hypothetical protein